MASGAAKWDAIKSEIVSKRDAKKGWGRETVGLWKRGEAPLPKNMGSVRFVVYWSRAGEPLEFELIYQGENFTACQEEAEAMYERTL